MSSRARHFVVLSFPAILVSDHDSPEVFGKSAFQATQRLLAGFAFGEFAFVVGPTGAGAHPDLRDRGDVQRRVELPVAAAREPVAGAFGAGDLDGCGAGVGGKLRSAGEAGWAARSARNLVGEPDATDLDQAAADRVTANM